MSMQSAALSVCGAMILLGMLGALVREKDQAMRFALRIFFLLALATPFLGGIEWDSFSEEIEMSGKTVDQAAQEQLLSAAERLLKQKAEELLKKEGITPAGIEFSLHTDEDGSIMITGLTVTAAPGALRETASASGILVQAFGITPEIREQREEKKAGDGE